MKKNNLKYNLLPGIINFFLVLILALGILAVSVNAQSTDPFNPTPMVSDIVKGRWSTGNPSYYYSFEAGPGVIVISFNAKPNISADYVGGELMDANNRAIIPVENRGKTNSSVAGSIGSEGKTFVATYELKRRQKLIFRFYSGGGTQDTGTYSIKMTGDGLSFDDDNSSTRINSTSNFFDKLSCLPKSGKIRLVMDDGTVQEINLSRVRETDLKP